MGKWIHCASGQCVTSFSTVSFWCRNELLFRSSSILPKSLHLSLKILSFHKGQICAQEEIFCTIHLLQQRYWHLKISYKKLFIIIYESFYSICSYSLSYLLWPHAFTILDCEQLCRHVQ